MVRSLAPCPLPSCCACYESKRPCVRASVCVCVCVLSATATAAATIAATSAAAATLAPVPLPRMLVCQAGSVRVSTYLCSRVCVCLHVCVRVCVCVCLLGVPASPITAPLPFPPPYLPLLCLLCPCLCLYAISCEGRHVPPIFLFFVFSPMLLLHSCLHTRRLVMPLPVLRARVCAVRTTRDGRSSRIQHKTVWHWW